MQGGVGLDPGGGSCREKEAELVVGCEVREKRREASMWWLPCSGAGGGGNTGGTAPLGGRWGSQKSSSDGLVKELLIWQHRALMLVSPSPGRTTSMSEQQRSRTRVGEREGGGGGE